MICLGSGGIATVGLCVVKAGRWEKVAVKDRYVFSDDGPYRVYMLKAHMDTRGHTIVESE